MAKLTVVRDTTIPDAFRRYDVLLDGREVGALKPGESVTVEVAPGSHTLALKIDWCGSRPATFVVAGDEAVNFRARSNLGPLAILFGMWFTLFRKDDYLALVPASALISR
jgi:hypothetical protein